MEDLQAAVKMVEPDFPLYPGQLKPSQIFNTRKDIIRDLVKKNNLTNPRVFGSVAKGNDTYKSDLDLVVDIPPGVSICNVDDPGIDLEEKFGIKVDVLATEYLSGHMNRKIEETAIAF